MSQLSQELFPFKKRNYKVNLQLILSESVHRLLSSSSIYYSDTEKHVKAEKAQNADIFKLFSVIVSVAISLVWEIFISPVNLKQNSTTEKQKRKLLYWHFYPCERTSYLKLFHCLSKVSGKCSIFINIIPKCWCPLHLLTKTPAACFWRSNPLNQCLILLWRRMPVGICSPLQGEQRLHSMLNLEMFNDYDK